MDIAYMQVPCPERISNAVSTHCIHSLFDSPCEDAKCRGTQWTVCVGAG